MGSKVSVVVLLVAGVLVAGVSRANAQVSPSIASCSYYAALKGSDSSPGTQSSPFRTIQHSVNAVGAAGGTVCIEDAGPYVESVTLQHSGVASKWLAIRGIATARATISPPSKGSFVININSRSYVAIEHVQTDGGEIGIVSSGGGGHWYVNDDEVENAIGSGVQLNNGDYVSVVGSLIHGNAAIWSNAGSGVSVYDPIQLDSARGPHIYIGANIIYDNSNPRGASDGNAIILDSFSDNRFAASSLIENNVAYGNAGACIKVYSNGGAPVLVRNNTCFKNQQLVSQYTWRGEISLEFSGGVTSVNNILWFDPTADSSNSGYLNGGSSGPANVAVSNLSYGGSSGSNPMLVSPPANMRLQTGSPAIGTGSTAYGIPAIDLIGALRSAKSVDIGAYAFAAASAAATPIEKASATPKATATPRSIATVTPTAIQTPAPRLRIGRWGGVF